MAFEDIVDQAIAMLQRLGRVAYRTLKRQFHLDDEALDDLKTEIIKGATARRGRGWCRAGVDRRDDEPRSARRGANACPTFVYPRASGGENSPVQGCAGGRAQAGHSPLCRSEEFDGVAGGS